MYGTRYGRGDDRGQTSHYRSTEPGYGPASGSRVSRQQEGRAVQSDGWDEDRQARVTDRGADANGRGAGTAAYRRGGSAAGGASNSSGGTTYGSGVSYGGGKGYDRYGDGGGQRRRRPPGEEYVPRRSAIDPGGRRRAIEPPRQAGDADWPPRRAADESPGRPANEPARRPANARQPQRPAAESRRKRKQMPLWQEMPLLLIVAFCLAVLIRTFLVQAFFIPSGSMTDTLLIGDRVLVNKVIYDMREPRRGEIVVFSGTDSWVPEVPDEPNLGFVAKLGRTVGDLVGVSRPGDKDFIKRVIGLPGDKVSCCDAEGRVVVNGRPLTEPYVIENSPLDAPPNPNECRSRRFAEVTVPPGQMFVMGDHRLVSLDARCQGPVPIKNVIGKAFVIVWPNEHWATLPLPSTFASVPEPVAAPAAGTGAQPLTNPPTGAFGIVLPILLPLLFSARSRRKFGGDRRRLAA